MVQHAHDLGYGAELGEYPEHQLQPFLNSHVGILDNHTAWIPNQADRQRESELAAFGLQFAHGLGLALHERPLISRLNSLKQPAEIKAGMVFALETYCPASDGFSAARIEEELVVTPEGCKVITLFPAQELPIANPY